MLHQVPETLFSKAKWEMTSVWKTFSPTSIWVSEFQLEKSTGSLCVGADGKHTITPHLVPAVRNRCWNAIKLLIWMLHLQAILHSFAKSFLLGVPKEINDCHAACHPSGQRTGNLTRGDMSRVRASLSDCTGLSKPLETEGGGWGGTSRASSVDCRERDGTVGAETWWRGVSVCLCVCVCVWEREKVGVCVCLRTFGLCVVSPVELAVRVWLKIWGNEQGEGEEQNLNIKTDSRTKTGQAQKTETRGKWQKEQKKGNY